MEGIVVFLWICHPDEAIFPRICRPDVTEKVVFLLIWHPEAREKYSIFVDGFLYGFGIQIRESPNLFLLPSVPETVQKDTKTGGGMPPEMCHIQLQFIIDVKIYVT